MVAVVAAGAWAESVLAPPGCAASEARAGGQEPWLQDVFADPREDGVDALALVRDHPSLDGRGAVVP